MERHVQAWMTATVDEGTGVALLITPSEAPILEESLLVRVGAGEKGKGTEHPVEESRDVFGNRMHMLKDLPAGPVEITYRARSVGQGTLTTVLPTDEVTYLRPSRYCEVDEFTRIAADVVGEAQGYEAVEKVVRWVNGYLSYVPGSSTITDSARSTYVARQGVCRDYAHLTATVLRAAGIPARCVAVYAPGLSPMDFYLVVEALMDGAWWVVDATGLAPRSSMVRIASGQDAADTAFMTTTTGHVELTGIQVGAVVDPELPREDGTERLSLR